MTLENGGLLGTSDTVDFGTSDAGGDSSYGAGGDRHRKI
jgi:hypothetical protein